MYELTVPQDVSVEGLGFAIAGSPLTSLSFAVFFREWLITLIPHTNAAQTGAMLELATKLAEVKAQDRVHLTDSAHEVLVRAAGQLSIAGTFALRVATFLHAIMTAQLMAAPS